MSSKQNQFKYKTTYKLKVNAWIIIYHASNNNKKKERKTRIGILISNKAKFRVKMLSEIEDIA